MNFSKSKKSRCHCTAVLTSGAGRLSLFLAWMCDSCTARLNCFLRHCARIREETAKGWMHSCVCRFVHSTLRIRLASLFRAFSSLILFFSFGFAFFVPLFFYCHTHSAIISSHTQFASPKILSLSCGFVGRSFEALHVPNVRAEG